MAMSQTNRVSTLVVIGTVLAMLSASAFGGYLETCYTVDDGAIDQMPPEGGGAGWNAVDQNDQCTIQLNAGESVWFACRNIIDEDPRKYFKFKIWYASGHSSKINWPPEAQGFTSNDDDDDVPGDFEGSSHGSESSVLYYIFGPKQPKWERVKITAAEDFGAAITFTAKMWSHCSENEPDWPDMKLHTTNASFGALGAVAGDPHVTEVWMFPADATVNTAIAPIFLADPSTGNWTPSFVYSDPDTTPRPKGGVRWLCDGAGLATADHYEQSFAMLGEVDLAYDLYAYDTQAGEYMDFKIRLKPYLCADANGDGMSDVFDVDAFVYAITHTKSEFLAQFPTSNYLNCDTNCDAYVDVFDIAVFVSTITGTPCDCSN